MYKYCYYIIVQCTYLLNVVQIHSYFYEVLIVRKEAILFNFKAKSSLLLKVNFTIIWTTEPNGHFFPL